MESMGRKRSRPPGPGGYWLLGACWSRSEARTKAAGPGPLGRSVKMGSLSPAVSQRMVGFLAHQNKADLAVLRELLDAGKVKPVIDQTYRLSEAAEAIGYLEQGHARGKVVITI